MAIVDTPPGAKVVEGDRPPVFHLSGLAYFLLSALAAIVSKGARLSAPGGGEPRSELHGGVGLAHDRGGRAATEVIEGGRHVR